MPKIKQSFAVIVVFFLIQTENVNAFSLQVLGDGFVSQPKSPGFSDFFRSSLRFGVGGTVGFWVGSSRSFELELGGWYGTGATNNPYRLVLDGSDDLVTTTVDIDNGAMSQMTLEMWVNPSRLNHASTQYIASSSNLGEDRGMLIPSSASDVTLGISGNSKWDTNVNLTTSAWQHLVAVYETRDVKLYVNGTLYSRGGNDSSLWNSSRTLYFGELANLGGGNWQGSMAYGAVYSTALTPTQVSQNCYALKDRFSGVTCAAVSISPAISFVAKSDTQTFSVKGGLAPYVFSVVGGNGSIDSSTGVYTAPSSAGSATIRVTDSQGNTSDSAVTIEDDSITTTGLVSRWDAARAVTTLKNFPIIGSCVLGTWLDFFGSSNGTINDCYGTVTTTGFQGTGATTNPYRFVFDGSDDRISTTLDIDNGAIGDGAIEMWVNPSRLTYGSAQYLMSSDTFSGGRGISIPANATDLTVGVNSNGAWDTNVNLSTSTWYHLVVVYSTTDVILYVNGTATSRGSTDSAFNSSRTLNFGELANDAGGNFQGSMAYAAVYNTTLSQAQVTANCNALKNRFDGVTCN